MKAQEPAFRFFAVLGLVLAAALPRPASAQRAPRPVSLVLPYRIEPKSFDPWVLDDATSFFVALIYDGLYQSSEAGEYVPDLVQRAEVSKDGLEWRLTLRPNILFQDGSRLGAEDVVASYAAIADPLYARRYLELLRAVKSCRAEGNGTVVLSLNAPNGGLSSLLGWSVVPARLVKDLKAFQERCLRDPVGTGPFRIVRRSPGEIVFEAFDGHFKGKPLLRSLTYQLFSDQQTAWVSFLKGDVDAITNMEPADYNTIRRDPRFNSFQGLDSFSYTLLFNLKDPLLARREMRQALAAAVDRDDLVEVALSGAGIPTCGPFMPGTWAYDPLCPAQRYDPSRARQILADLGWEDADGDRILENGGAKLAFKVLIDEGDASKEGTAKRLRWQFLQVGVRMDVEMVPVDQFVNQRVMPGAYQAALLQFNVSLAEPGNLANRSWHSRSIGRSNLAGYASAEADRLIDEGLRVADQVQRTDIFHKLQAVIASDVPAVFLYHKIQYMAVSSRFGGVSSSNGVVAKSNAYLWYLKPEK